MLTRNELWDHLPDDVRSSAFRLDEQPQVMKIHEDAFPIKSTEAVLVALADANVVVLGGDFWHREQGDFGPVYANWHYDGTSPADSVDLARRTLREPWVSGSWYVTFVWR